MQIKNIIISSAILAMFAFESCTERENLGRLENGARVILQKNSEGRWDISVDNQSLNAVSPSPACGVEIYHSEDSITKLFSGYSSYEKSGSGFKGKATVTTVSASYIFNDEWKISENILFLKRKVKVEGNSNEGFLSSVELKTAQKFAREDVNIFAPGMIYGSTAHLTDSAIGGKDLYLAGKGTLWIREDRLPSPMLGLLANDMSAVTILNPLPNGETDTLDSQDIECKTLINHQVLLGAVGLVNKDGFYAIGYHFPCSEGEYTYQGATYPNGQKHQWRRRYHPVINGFEQTYSVSFRFSDEKTFSEFYVKAWRWAWQTLKPRVIKQDIELAKTSMLDMLAGLIQVTPNHAGIRLYQSAAKNESKDYARQTILGFVGKALEVSNYLLYGSLDSANPNAAKYRELAYRIFDSFIRMPLNPPVGEGFNMETGEFTIALTPGQVYLRSFGDDLKAMMKAVLREGSGSYHYKEYIAWNKSFADWLLTQQNSEGGFPRKWIVGTGEVAEKSASASYNAVPFLILMSKATGQTNYLDAAVKAADYCWDSGQIHGVFVGGTIDNPDVIDKEAGTLSLEAYIMLYEHTKNKKWLRRAQMAADFSETWIYAWNVPMPSDSKDEQLQWKRGNSTVGLQLISSGHSLTDCYMAFDVDEFAKMAKYTNDDHYLEVSEILLHNTKQMLAIPGRLYDLNGPGWQQEHWSLAPVRGNGLHRGWLPWVTTSQLNGIFGLEEYDQELYRQMIQ